MVYKGDGSIPTAAAGSNCYKASLRIIVVTEGRFLIANNSASAQIGLAGTAQILASQRASFSWHDMVDAGPALVGAGYWNTLKKMKHAMQHLPRAIADTLSHHVPHRKKRGGCHDCSPDDTKSVKRMNASELASK
jgi:hypothetical protein